MRCATWHHLSSHSFKVMLKTESWSWLTFTIILITLSNHSWYLFLSFVGFSVGRTFGRIRLIRQMVLPITFFGGFLTAIIFGIAKTGIINMLLIKAVLFLQMALIIGKLACGAKELFLHKSSAHEIVYYPQPQPSSHYGSPPSSSYGWKRNGNQEEVFKDYYPSPMEYEHQAGYVSPYNFVNHQQQASLNRDYIQPSSAISRRGIIKRSSGESMADSPNYLPNHRMPMATHAINVLPLSQLIESRSASQQTITHQNHNHNTNYPNYWIGRRYEWSERKRTGVEWMKISNKCRALYLSIYWDLKRFIDALRWWWCLNNTDDPKSY